MKETQEECLLVTTLFNAKYKDFKLYIQKFTEEEQKMISKVVNEEPYATVNADVFRD